MTKKERAIKACRELAAKYREPEGEVFFSPDQCPLCIIQMGGTCGECPLNISPEVGCSNMKTYRTAHEYYVQNGCNVGANPAFDARAAFFDKIIPILEEIPASRFTKRGWKYFDEFDRSW